jgi:hypothetical protein
MLPALSLAFPHCDTGIALQGVRRPGGQRGPSEDAAGARGRTVPAPMTTGAGEDRLRAVANELRSPSSSPTSTAQRWRECVRASMRFKQELYRRERGGLQEQIDDAQLKAAAFVQQARSGAAPLADDRTSNWEVAEKVSARWQSLVTQAASLDRIVESARQRHDLINNQRDFGALRVELASAIDTLVNDHAAQGLLLEGLADTVDAFLNAPLVQSNALINFLIMGNAGAGKTRLASAVASLLSKLGLFVYDSLAVCGRSDFVAEYEGQTAVKTRGFLSSQLERVVFLDEAYSLTQWEQKGEERTLSAYSAEAVSELVAFLSQRVGAVCFIAAGYEHEMLKDFLPSNVGLSRRFPLRVWLRDYSADQLVSIYLSSLAAVLSPSLSAISSSTVETYFTTPALAFLTDILQGSTGPPTLYLSTLFSAQAGAMVTLANVTAVLISSHKDYARIGLSAAGLDTWALGVIDVYDILRTVLQQQLGPDAALGVQELRAAAQASGWLTSGGWQVPPPEDRDESRRQGRRRGTVN